MSEDSRLEELLIGEFKDAVKSLRDELRTLEKAVANNRAELQVSKEVKKAERATIATLAAAASAVVALGAKLLEGLGK